MDERPELVRLSEGRGAGARLLGVAAVGAIAVAIVAIGLVGGGDPDPPVAPAATPAARAGATSAAAPTALATPAPPTVELPLRGYAVRYDGEPQLYDEDTFGIYRFASGQVTVAVGTPSRGASLLGEGITTRIYAGSLDRLGLAYLAETPFTLTGGDDITVDGQPARVLALGVGPDGQPIAVTALFVYGNRSYVISAPDRRTLDPFLAGFTFGPRLFVSRDLGFQVPLLVDEPPFGVTVSRGTSSSAGLWVFPDGDRLADGEYSHAIGVSIGTEDQPANVRNVPSDLPYPSPRRLWAPTLAELVRGYRRIVDPGEGLVAPTILGGEPATLVIRADGLAATVLAVHLSRAYIISTTGAAAVERAPHFEQFLATFTFLEYRCRRHSKW